MSGEYTRFTFKPKKDYSAVLKQQGRVDLDADFNELIEIFDRRWRSETIDVIGHCIVPITTADAFLIAPTALGDFSIGVGRMYVDGIQVENHGLAPDQYLADLGEVEGTQPVSYQDQPYLPTPLPPPLAAAANTSDLVYLNVWQREVNALEDPSIREIALGGPDTTNRVQSVWQVRVLEDIGDHSCGDNIAIWSQTIAPSAGRLTTTASAPPAADDPCIIATSGGYRGLENRLYRVEIHSVGPIGGGAPAKFKWSRNNASVASSITEISTSTKIKVQQVGRDRVLRFEIGNWIEITDDFREFQSLAGHMAQISAIDEANRSITFAPAIPGAFNFNAADPSRHTRATRWDQTQSVDANGLLDVIVGPIDVEDGIRVTFTLDPAGGNVKIGDYWVFAARTPDGSVEFLQNAPPRGILHHFCRLGFIHWGNSVATTTFTDCREHWPPCDCDCCTVTVGDGVDSHGQFTDIQQAIDALGDSGGVVCIGRGFYTVRTGLRLDSTKRNVVIRGMGPATRIAFVPEGPGPDVFMEINGTDHVCLEGVFIAASNADALIRVSGSHFCRVADCILVNVPGREVGTAARGIQFVENCSHCEIVHNALIASKAVASSGGEISELQVRDNQALSTQVAVSLLLAEAVEIIHNQFRGLPNDAFPNGPGLTRDSVDGFQRGVSNLFAAATTINSFQAAGVLIYFGNRVVIRENLLLAQVAIFGFLFINVRIKENDIASLIGVLVALSVLMKIEDNFVFGLLAGAIQAGITAVVDYTSNEWIGLSGIVWMSLAELMAAFGNLLAAALAAVGFAAGAAVLQNAAKTGTSATGEIGGFALAILAKIHRNDFLSFSRGIYKTDSVISADISIIDNSFLLCAEAGIELGGGGRGTQQLDGFLLRILNFRHLIQGNALTVSGTGVITSTPVTFIEQNTIQAQSVACEIDAFSCTVKNNFLYGWGTEPLQGVGLLNLFHGARQTTISGNQVLNAPGHGILLREDVSIVCIDDNLIQGARFTGIGTLSDAVLVQQLSISRNRIEGCQAAVPAGGAQITGAVAIADGKDVRLIDNVIFDNAVARAQNTPGSWFAVYFGNVDGLEMRGNRLSDNATTQGFGILTGATLLHASGTVRIQDNVIRGNGGSALDLFGTLGSQTAPTELVIQNNLFMAGPNQLLFFVSVVRANSLLFQGNQCFRPREGGFWIGNDVFLEAQRANVSGNSIETGNMFGMIIRGDRLIVNANSVESSGPIALQANAFFLGGPMPVSLILTSNLTSGLLIAAMSGGVLNRVGNFPAP